MIKESPLDTITYVNGSYRTGVVRRSLLGRISPAARLYSRLLSIVWRGSAKAKRGRYLTADWVASSLETLRALEEIGAVLEINGVYNFRTLDGPCVFIGHHMSTLETMVLPCIISQFKNSTFVVKQSLVDYPVFKHIMRSRDPITVGRTDPREDLKAVLEGGVDRIRQGVSLVIFPQTTRTVAFDLAFVRLLIYLCARCCDLAAWTFSHLASLFSGLSPRAALACPAQLPHRPYYQRNYEQEPLVYDKGDETLESWEIAVIERHQIRSGSMLVLGAGWGREAIALGRRGLTVVALTRA